MKDIGFNEKGELANNDDEESLKKGGQTEMTQINSTQNSEANLDPDGEKEAENTEIAL